METGQKNLFFCCKWPVFSCKVEVFNLNQLSNSEPPIHTEERLPAEIGRDDAHLEGWEMQQI